MKTFKERIGKEWLFFDGGSGTILQSMGLRGGELPESWNRLHPDRVVQLAYGYLMAGADIINTNTFGANRLHYGDDTEEIVRLAVRHVKTAKEKANRPDAFIALDLGPTGKLLEPMGSLDFEDAVSIYAEVVKAGADEGADLVLVETMSDTLEAKAAIIAAKENCELPIIATMTYTDKGKLLTGGTVESTVAMLEGLGVDALGINCSLGPDQMIPIVKEIVKYSSTPVVVSPNAGIPYTKHGRTIYPVGPEEFSDIMSEIAELGVQVVGGCCGTTPDHISLMIENIRKLEFHPIEKKHRTIVTSFARAVEIGNGTVIVGERINPTGKKAFKEALRNKDYDYIVRQGLQQEDAGAHILDVNVGLPEIDEPEMMVNVVKKLQAVTTLPLQIDTSNVEALERAMRVYNGKPMINSVNGKRENIAMVMPLVKKYGGVLVGLCLDEDGIGDNVSQRLKAAETILKAADDYGIRREDIVLDGLAMTVSSDNGSAVTTLETIRTIRHTYHVNTILGVSNISFGLPQRQLVNANFLTMAMNNGLSCAILNPNNELMMSAYRSSMVLLNKDPQCQNFISSYAGTEDALTITANHTKTAEVGADSLHDCIIRGLTEGAYRLAKEELQTKEGLTLINEQLIPALDEVGIGFEKGTIFLPQLLMSADAAKAAFTAVKESMVGKPQNIKGRVILATVKGDIHDIGKNIVKVMLENYGYDVIDLGKDVDPQVIVDTAVNEDIPLVGLSALMTTTVVNMEETIRLLKKEKPEVKIIVGGAVLTEDYAMKIGADAYGKDAMATVRYADSIFTKE